ncbi:MAG TPA: peptide deformylase, partial [Gammaproteobacteria bacterium]|nr:peptide deformylase [Gammaproteobacteria bacterium]
MTTLDILHFPDPRLRNVAQPVERVDDDIRQLVDDMFQTMYAAPGIGLAATQVNVDKRVIVIDVSEEKDQPLCLINPQILARDGVEEMEEGCLSVPGVFELVERADHVRIQALNRDGEQFELEAGDLLAVCIQ